MTPETTTSMVEGGLSVRRAANWMCMPVADPAKDAGAVVGSPASIWASRAAGRVAASIV